MTRLHILTFCGVLLIASGLGVLLMGEVPAAAAQEAAEVGDYVGASECADCHRDVARRHDDSAHVLTLQDDEDAIIADFSVGESERQVQLPGSDSARAFTADDVAYTLGTGQYVQRYLYEVDRNEYRVLPAEWDVANQVWRPLALAESWDDPAYDWEQSCAYCHTTGFDIERGRWEDDGVQCESCHGPGENHVEIAEDVGRRPSEEELAEVRAAINPGLDPQICGQCHSRGVSADGQPFPVGYYPGGTLSDHFTPVTADQGDHWWVTGHARQMNMQYNEWATSAHAGSLQTLLESDEADVSCLSCHSADSQYIARLTALVDAGDREGLPPEALTLETAQYGVSCTSCHDPHTESEQPANLVQESYSLCVSCHSNTTIAEGIHHPVQEMWEGIRIVEEIEAQPGVHFLAENGPTCATCHAASVPVEEGMRVSHALMPVLPGVAVTEPMLQDNCSGCHEEVATPELMQALIDDIQNNTRARIDTARAAINETTPAWVSLALDFVEGDGSLGIHNYTYSDAVLDAVYDELQLFALAGQ